MVSDKMIHRTFTTRATLFKQNSEKFSNFTIYQNYTLLALRYLFVSLLYVQLLDIEYVPY